MRHSKISRFVRWRLIAWPLLPFFMIVLNSMNISVSRGVVHSSTNIEENKRMLPATDDDASQSYETAKTSSDPRLFFSAEMLLRNFPLEKNSVLVDVRNQEEFRKLKIPGSIHVPLFAVKTKPFLKQKKLIIIDDGHEMEQLYREREKLLENGFESVRILRGGFPRWAALGGAVAGDPTQVARTMMIDSRSLLCAKKRDDWLIVDIRPSESAVNCAILKTVNIPYTGDAKLFLRELAATIHGKRNRDFITVVLLNDRGVGYEPIQAAMRECKLSAGIQVNVFYLEGGLEGYRSFVRNQTLILEHASEKTCGECP